MQKKDYSWLWGAGIGMVLGGPLGALVGGFVGKVVGDNRKSQEGAQTGDVVIAFLYFCSRVVRADGRVTSAEVQTVKDFLIKQFGVEHSKELMPIFKRLVEDPDVAPDFGLSVRNAFDFQSRAILIQLLCEIAISDGEFHPHELKEISATAQVLGLSQREFLSILEMYRVRTGHQSGSSSTGTVHTRESDLAVLELDKDASDADVKKAYRQLVKKYHPDKVAHLESELCEKAEARFRAIQESYERLSST